MGFMNVVFNVTGDPLYRDQGRFPFAGHDATLALLLQDPSQLDAYDSGWDSLPDGKKEEGMRVFVRLARRHNKVARI